jgi:hypothetical protein
VNASLLAFWSNTAQRAEAVAQGDNIQDTAAVMAAYSMVDAVRHGRRIPLPLPELNAKLAHAEVLAQRA